MKAAIIPLLFLLALPFDEVRAQEGSKPWWNPLAPSSTTSEGNSEVQKSSFFDSKPAPAFKVPQLSWPSFGGGKKTQKGPSTFAKMSRTSKNMWNSTVDFLNPFDSPPPPPKKTWLEPQLSNKEKSSESGWKWPWTQEKKSEPPASVSEFLKQPRPQF